MGDLAAHIADTARFTHPEHAVPPEFEGAFTELSEIAAGMADRVGELITGEAKGGFAELDETDQAVDALHARVLTSITGESWGHGVQSATSPPASAATTSNPNRGRNEPGVYKRNRKPADTGTRVGHRMQ